MKDIIRKKQQQQKVPIPPLFDIPPPPSKVWGRARIGKGKKGFGKAISLHPVLLIAI